MSEAPQKPNDLEKRLEKLEKLLSVGKENKFVLAWGRLLAYVAQQRWAFIGVLMVSLVLAVGLTVLSLRFSKRDVVVLKVDTLGNVVQTDWASILKAGEPRDEMEIKNFALRWVRDAYEFTPLDVQDRLIYALRFVEPNAQNAVKYSLRLNERNFQVSGGASIKVKDDPSRGYVPQVAITRADPLEVMVTFTRISRLDGKEQDLPPLAITLRLRYVPRSQENGHGLMVSDLTSTS